MKTTAIRMLTACLLLTGCKSGEKDKDEASEQWQPPKYMVRIDRETLESALTAGQTPGVHADLEGKWIEVKTYAEYSETYNWAGYDVIRSREEGTRINTWMIKRVSSGLVVDQCEVFGAGIGRPSIQAEENSMRITGVEKSYYGYHLHALSAGSASLIENKIADFGAVEYEEQWQHERFSTVHGVIRGVLNSKWYKVSPGANEIGIGIVTVDGVREDPIQCIMGGGAFSYDLDQRRDTPSLSSYFDVKTSEGWTEFYRQMNLISDDGLFWFQHESGKVFVIQTNLENINLIPQIYRMSIY